MYKNNMDGISLTIFVALVATPGGEKSMHTLPGDVGNVNPMCEREPLSSRCMQNVIASRRQEEF